MPDSEVKTIRDLIYFQYAKIIVKSAMRTGDNGTAKSLYYGMIKNKFRDLKSGKISWSAILREDLQFMEAKKTCIYCGCCENITKDHIIPKTTKINCRCSTCDKIQGIHNIIWACRSCNSKKGIKGLYEFMHELHPNCKKSDAVPTLLEKKYLKLIYCCHECAGTLDSGDLNGDGELNVFDLDYILHK